MRLNSIGSRELNKFLENLNWSSTEFDPIYADELAGFVPSLDSSATSLDNGVKKLAPKLSLNDNLGIAHELQNQQHQAINNIAVRNMVEAEAFPSAGNFSNPVVLTHLLGLYVAQQNDEDKIMKGQKTAQNYAPMQRMVSSTTNSVPTTGEVPSLKRPLGAMSSSGFVDEQGNKQFSDYSNVAGFNPQQFAPPIEVLEDDDDFDVEDNETHSATSSVMTPKERRRERNKVLARKTRMKKKAELETLRNQVKELSNENRQLKMARYVLTLELLGNHRVPDNIRQRIRGSPSSPPSDSAFTINSVFNDNAMKSVAELLSKSQRSFCITNHNLPDLPIIYASPLFLDLTGYSAEEAVGRNCRFLQGRETNRNDVMRIREAIKAGNECHVALLNYRKNGSKFWNSIHLSPMKAGNGEVLLYVGIQVEITAEKAQQINSSTGDIHGNALSSSAGTDNASDASCSDEFLSIADNASVPMFSE